MSESTSRQGPFALREIQFQLTGRLEPEPLDRFMEMLLPRMRRHGRRNFGSIDQQPRFTFSRRGQRHSGQLQPNGSPQGIITISEVLTRDPVVVIPQPDPLDRFVEMLLPRMRRHGQRNFESTDQQPSFTFARRGQRHNGQLQPNGSPQGIITISEVLTRHIVDVIQQDSNAHEFGLARQRRRRREFPRAEDPTSNPPHLVGQTIGGSNLLYSEAFPPAQSAEILTERSSDSTEEHVRPNWPNTQTYRYKKASADSANGEGSHDCAVCFDDLEEDQEIRCLPCMHQFHMQCVDRWLVRNETCPTCRCYV